jgi:hypothetical protein
MSSTAKKTTTLAEQSARDSKGNLPTAVVERIRARIWALPEGKKSGVDSTCT